MDSKCLNHVYMISFLDSLCTGITLPVLNNYLIASLHGSHLIIGLLATLQVLSQIITSLFLTPLTRLVGVKNLFLISHIVTLLNYVIIIIANDYQLFVLFRVPYFIFNQTTYLTEVLISKVAYQRDQANAHRTIRQLNTLALILGPMCGGILYHSDSILCVTCMLNILTIISFIVAVKLPQDKHCPLKLQYPRPLIRTLMQNDWKSHWNNKPVFSLLKILTSAGLSTYFMKFSLCLKENLNASSSLIGFTISFQNTIFLVAQFGCVVINGWMKHIHVFFKQCLISCILMLTLSMYILCTTKDYGTYLSAFVLLALSREFFERLWSIESEPMTRHTVESILMVFTCFTPLVLGFFCDAYLQNAVRTMSLLPLIAALWICLTGFQKERMEPNSEAIDKRLFVTNKKID